MQPAQPWLSRFAYFVVAFTLALIFIGGMVTSLDAGMTVPDWPTTFGYNMFAFPISRWVGLVFWEHSHRVVASILGILTTVLAVWIWLAESRRWLKGLGASAFVLVVIQGLMGGFRVTADSRVLAILHGCLAQVFLCLLVWIALALGSGWQRPAQEVSVRRLLKVRRWAWILTGAVFLQLLLGAIMRHLKAGLAIATFPPYGSFFPVIHNPLVDLHLTHRLWAIAVSLIVIVVAAKVLRGPTRAVWQFVAPVLWLLLLVGIQILFGASIIWLARAPIPTSLHVLNGAIILALSFALAIRSSYFVSRSRHEPHRTSP